MAVIAGISIALTACDPLATPRVEPRPAAEATSPSSHPPATTGSSTASSPESTPSAPSTVPADRRWAPGKFQYGIQVYAHNTGGQATDAHISAVLDYIVARGGNSLGLTFPLYTDGLRSTSVHPGPETPSVEAISVIIQAARSRGLRTMIRPIIDEANLRTTPGGWRGALRPTDVRKWFSGYTAALVPYLDGARAARADEFVLATELTSLQSQGLQWQALRRAAGQHFDGALSFAFNWDTTDSGLLPKADSRVAAGIDLYFAVNLDDSATVPQLAAALKTALMAKPAPMRAVMSAQEVGIPAISGAYKRPWDWGDSSGARLLPEIQARWFTAACQAVKESGLNGIYFWMLDSTEDPRQIDPAASRPANFVGRPGESSIESCFRG